MRALVAGGAGFVGSHLVDRLLAEDHEVDVVDDLSSGSLANLSEARAGRTRRLKIHQVDVRDAGVTELVERRAPEVVFLLAGRDLPAIDDVEAVVEGAAVTILGGIRLLEGARRSGSRKVVVASTAAVYRPPEPSELPVKESHPQEPVHPQGVAAKSLADHLVAYRQRFDLEFTALALADVYGPRQTSGLVAELVRGALAGEPTAGDVDVRQTRDLVFVDDVVDAFVRAAERGSGLLVNVGSATETSVADLRAAVQRAVGLAGSAQVGPEHGESGWAPYPVRPPRLRLDIGRARIHLGWTPWTSLDDGLGQTVDDARS